MNRHPNIALFGGTLIIAIKVMAAFANVANAGGCSYCKSKSTESTTEEVKDKAAEKKLKSTPDQTGKRGPWWTISGTHSLPPRNNVRHQGLNLSLIHI